MSKCSCGCAEGKCRCKPGCKCGCNHEKGGADWAQKVTKAKTSHTRNLGNRIPVRSNRTNQGATAPTPPPKQVGVAQNTTAMCNTCGREKHVLNVNNGICNICAQMQGSQ